MPRRQRKARDPWNGGQKHRFGLSPTLVRALFVISIVLPGPQVLVYLVLWVLLPKRP